MKRKYIYFIFLLFLCFLLFFGIIQNQYAYTYKYNYLIDFDNDIVYEKNIYSIPIFHNIVERCNQIPEYAMKNDNKASGRLMYTFSNNDQIIQLIYHPDMMNKIRKITGNPKLVPCLEIPVEYRKYVKGSYMHWHRDTPMLEDQLQYECVITLDNTSDSKTLFIKNNQLHEISSVPNSLIIVRANGIEHKVTTTNMGERRIIKFVCKETN